MAGGKLRTREAASSIASGNPSSRWHSAATAEALASVRAKPGEACVARSANRRTASYPPAVAAREDACSPGTGSGWTS